MCYINDVAGIRVIGPVPMITQITWFHLASFLPAIQHQTMHKAMDYSHIANPALITVKPKGLSTL